MRKQKIDQREREKERQTVINLGNEKYSNGFENAIDGIISRQNKARVN